MDNLSEKVTVESLNRERSSGSGYVDDDIRKSAQNWRARAAGKVRTTGRSAEADAENGGTFPTGEERPDKYDDMNRTGTSESSQASADDGELPEADEDPNGAVSAVKGKKKKRLSRKKEKNTEEKARNREIKKILLNNMILTNDGRMAAGPDHRIMLWGTGDGAGETSLLGVSERVFPFSSDFDGKIKTVVRAQKAMRDIGRGLSLATAPDSAACLVRHFFFRPVVLVFDEAKDTDKEGGYELRAYCGRAITTGFSIRHALSVFEKALPRQITRIMPEKPEKKRAE